MGAAGRGSLLGPELARIVGIDEQLPDVLLDAVPDPSYDVAAYHLRPVDVTRSLEDGDLIDLGDRVLRVLHLPGHSPGSICLYDEAGRTLFSGDVVYDGGLLDDIDGSDRTDYLASMARLLELDVDLVHPGHGPSFDGDRLVTIANDYVDRTSRLMGQGSDMARYGAQFGPDITFLGVERCDWAEPSTYADADVVILGAPFDGGTSHRPGTRFGPQYIRQTCYLPHDGSRPSLALRVDGLRDLTVYDAGDVEMYSGDAERSVRDLQAAVLRGRPTGRDPADPRRRPHHRLARRRRGRAAPRPGPDLDDPLRRARRHRRHRVRLAGRARPADAAADRVRRAARRPVPADRAARLLAGAGDAGLDGRAGHALLRDDRDRRAAVSRSA